jgi:transcriptional regulator with XRE-family HTH domain
LYFIYNEEQREVSNMSSKAIFGEFFKSKRIQLGLSLREFCKVHGLDPGNLSRLERGLSKPPEARDKLEAYATFLKIKRGTDDWYQFFDLAAACKGEIPEEFIKDKELLENLPLIFRTFRNKKISRELVREFVQRLKKL